MFLTIKLCTPAKLIFLNRTVHLYKNGYHKTQTNKQTNFPHEMQLLLC